MAKKKSTPPSSPLERSLRLFSAATQIAGREISRKVKDVVREKLDDNLPELVKTRIAQAKILTQSLSQLKGAAMKVGQLISIDAADFLPPEAVEILSQLQNKSDPVDFEIMQKMILNELGKEKFELIHHLNEVNVAAASIGQVYKAKLQGENIALKVQYPGVAESIDSDISVLKKILVPLLQLSGRNINLDETFKEIEIMLKLEVDYTNEADCLSTYREYIKDNQDYIVPTVFKDFSTRRLLCMSWEDGLMFTDWLKTNPSQETRIALAEKILNLYMLEFFEWGFVQTDPNFGNFLVQENPLRLVLLDFGSTKRYERPFIESYKNLLQTFAERNQDSTVRVAIETGLLDERESLEAKGNFFKMMQIAMEPFWPENQPFSFASQDYAKRNRDAILKFTASLKYSPPPRQIIFLHRKLGGIFNLLKRMEVTLDLTKIKVPFNIDR